jgi:hypothetical protein
MKILINLVLNKFYREYARILPNPIFNIKTGVISLSQRHYLSIPDALSFFFRTGNPAPGSLYLVASKTIRER